MVRVLVNGGCGRMGQAVIKAVLEDKELSLVAAVDLKGGMDAGTLVGIPACGVVVTVGLEEAIATARPDVMVDFTRPSAVFQNAVIALRKGVSPVIGTTGLSAEEETELAKIAEETGTPAFIAPNFAIGAVLMMEMAQLAAKYLPDVEIIELHHDQKLDAPSGTALQTAERIRAVRKSHRQGHPEETEKLTGARGAELDGIRIHSVRLPGFVAHQEVIFGALGQTLTIRHDSLDRASFMPGVVLACKKIRQRQGLTIGLDKLL